MQQEQQPAKEPGKAEEKCETEVSTPKPAKKKLTLEIADVSETMNRLERKISP
jgi:hypothetical protein